MIYENHDGSSEYDDDEYFYHSCFGDGVGGNDNGTDDDNTDRWRLCDNRQYGEYKTCNQFCPNGFV